MDYSSELGFFGLERGRYGRCRWVWYGPSNRCCLISCIGMLSSWYCSWSSWWSLTLVGCYIVSLGSVLMCSIRLTCLTWGRRWIAFSHSFALDGLSVLLIQLTRWSVTRWSSISIKGIVVPEWLTLGWLHRSGRPLMEAF